MGKLGNSMIEDDIITCRKCGKRLGKSAKYYDDCGAKQKRNSLRKGNGDVVSSPRALFLVIISLLSAIAGLSLGVVGLVRINYLNDAIISKDIHTDGDWYYYFELEMKNDTDGWPESYIMNRRSEKVYSSFDQCKQAFVNDYADAAGGCAKNCEVLPQSAYALRLHTCEDVVRF